MWKNDIYIKLKFKGNLLWNSLSDEVKTAKSLAIFKQKNQIQEWHSLHVQHLLKLVISILILIYFTSFFSSVFIKSLIFLGFSYVDFNLLIKLF